MPIARVSVRGRAFIKQWEGLRLKPYICAGGWSTVGYGHVIVPTDSRIVPGIHVDGITPNEAEYFFDRDVARAESALSSLIEPRLTQSQVDALGSFTFNLGAAALQRSTLRRRINRGESPQRCAAEIVRWVFASGVRVRGLVLRREAERRMYLSDIHLVSTDADVGVSSPESPATLSRPKSWWQQILDAIAGGIR